MTGKGYGCGGCCCGGCWSPPTDPRAATTADIIEVQQYCCKCIPKYLCVSLTSTGYDESTVLLSRFCGADYVGDPIQYSGTISWDGTDATIKIRLSVVDGECSLTWEIVEQSETGSVLIDHTQAVNQYDCRLGMATETCVNFGGTWDIDGRTLTISPANTLDISKDILCAGCSCTCECLCMSIYSQASGENFTMVGTNERVCATITEAIYENCDGSKTETIKSATWTSNGWAVSLQGGYDFPPDSRTVNTGSETAFSPCTINELLRFGDEFEHVIDDSSGTVQVTYEWDIEDRTPLTMRWVGRSHDQYAELEFEAYNWVTVGWDSLGTKAGRADAITINQFFKSNLTSEHVGTGGDLGAVRIRLTATTCSQLRTDLLRITTTRCCKLKLIPPESVTPAETIADHDLSQEGNCPEIFKFWQFTGEDGTEYYVTVDCAWCGTICGTVSTECCPRPIPRVLFAEVTIDCPTCIESPFTVPLISTAGSLWEGTGTHCAQDFTVSLSCSGGAWSISVEGTGACTFSDTADTTDCDPFVLTFSGELGGGIGCCGPFGGMVTPAISILVYE